MKNIFLTFSLLFLFSACSFSSESSEDSSDTGLLDDFAACLTEQKAVFYGTEWCIHCKRQKSMFGNSLKNINYIDCDKSGSQCRDVGITGYPTWQLQDGTLLEGVQLLKTLSEKTGCSV